MLISKKSFQNRHFKQENETLKEATESVSLRPFFFFFLIYLLIYGCVGVFVAAHRLSLVVASGGYSSLRCAGFSLRWLLLLWSMGSRHAGFSGYGSWAQ